MSDIALVQVTFGSVEEAEAIARAVVEERLAACANVMASCTSVYRWRDRVESEVETPVLFKTSVARALPLRDRIAELHSYDLPMIELWPAAATDAALKWIEDAVGD
ncbi:divalent-cation tolerance protein CutA [Sphingomonas sp.]|uniref:divalent-cation tolerance protein CutA n=1 Tax=Sphingomonas sp. TaxID=28214 RepID=UPI002C925383|nr:divalent-cation tolerance protein CutA [Sphingomonas sp.]HTG37479.1 divalent-cation tolerance protein CutA [Sphingomonas sp.]